MKRYLILLIWGWRDFEITFSDGCLTDQKI